MLLSSKRTLDLYFVPLRLLSFFLAFSYQDPELTSTSPDAFKTQVTDYKGPVIVDYFATWCGPCKAISPVLEKLSNEHEGIRFVKVDVDKLASVAADNSISAMPTFQFYKGGEVIETVRGANPPGIQAGLQKLLAQ